jgi:hypothetical protein
MADEKVVAKPKAPGQWVWAVNGWHGTPDGQRIQMILGQPVEGVGADAYVSLAANGVIKKVG